MLKLDNFLKYPTEGKSETSISGDLCPQAGSIFVRKSDIKSPTKT